MISATNSKVFSFVNISIATNCVVIVFGMCVFLPLGYVTKYFQSSCVLYGNPKLRKEINTTMIVVDTSGSEQVWGNTTNCYYSTFTPLIAAVHAFIWCWFFISMKKILTRQGHELPAYLLNVVFNLIIFVAQLVSSGILTSGASSFCNHVESSLGISCRDSQNLIWSVFNTRGILSSHHFYSFLLMSQVCSWLLTALLLFQCVISIYMGLNAVLEHGIPQEKDNESLFGYTNHVFGSYSELTMDNDTGSYKFSRNENDEKDLENFYNL